MNQNNSSLISLVSLREKQVSRHEDEWLHSNDLNRWQNWYCSAGLSSLYIDFEGDIFVGTCAVGGKFGNVFSENLFAPGKQFREWVRCSAKACVCGADMANTKVRKAEWIPENLNEIFANFPREEYAEVEHVGQPDIVFSPRSKARKRVTWDLGRRCNFSCSYCFPEIHNKHEAHKPLGLLAAAIGTLEKCWLEGEAATFSIAGGEPTLHPHYLQLVKMILAKNPRHRVVTTTNGSRDVEFFGELMMWSSLIFSAHSEALENTKTYKRFVENIVACIAAKKSGGFALLNGLKVRLMLKPDGLPFVKKLAAELLQIPHFSELASLTCDGLHQGREKTLHSYSEEEIEFIRHFSGPPLAAPLPQSTSDNARLI